MRPRRASRSWSAPRAAGRRNRWTPARSRARMPKKMGTMTPAKRGSSGRGHTGDHERLLAAYDAFSRREGPPIERALQRILPSKATAPREIHRAMHYMIFPGGKRLRPLMVVLAHRTCGGSSRRVYDAAAAMEMIHTFSLIHDDLPCMDDDDYRRGRLSCHKKFGEATAVLAGDALLVRAIEVLGRVEMGRNRSGIVAEVAAAIGTHGVIGGQSLDLASEGRAIRRRTLETIHRRKTAALFDACLGVGAMLAGAPAADVRRLKRFGDLFGLAFQVADDLLNVEGDFRRLGRPAGSDAAHEKATYPRIVGREKTHAVFRRLMDRVVDRGGKLGRRGPVFQGLAYKVARRVPGWGGAIKRGDS
ncbi:MAG: hypothetical protein GF355_14820 [Candidatus Eisenbacteria bacterium]|nr:hypothetical protein [Candidatus Eisenbacteria bacterium]